jgi:hypothetical protein
MLSLIFNESDREYSGLVALNATLEHGRRLWCTGLQCAGGAAKRSSFGEFASCASLAVTYAQAASKANAGCIDVVEDQLAADIERGLQGPAGKANELPNSVSISTMRVLLNNEAQKIINDVGAFPYVHILLTLRRGGDSAIITLQAAKTGGQRVLWFREQLNTDFRFALKFN